MNRRLNQAIISGIHWPDELFIVFLTSVPPQLINGRINLSPSQNLLVYIIRILTAGINSTWWKTFSFPTENWPDDEGFPSVFSLLGTPYSTGTPVLNFYPWLGAQFSFTRILTTALRMSFIAPWNTKVVMN